MINYSDLTFQQRIQGEQAARLAAYKRGWQYYDGEHSLPLKVKPGQADDNVVVNLYEYIIDKGVSFLFGKPIEFQLAEGASEQATQVLDQLWDTNHKMSWLQRIALNGGVCGHVFVKLAPQADNSLRLINLDPAIVTPLWNPDDIEDVLRYTIEYEGLDKDGKQIFRKQEIEAQKDEGGKPTAWVITNYTKRGNSRYVQDGTPLPWEYPFAPIVQWQNLPKPNEFFGKADIESVRMQNAVNFVASNVQRIVRYHGHPKTVGKGFKVSELQTGVDEMFILPSESANVWNLEMQSDLAATDTHFDRLVNLFMRTKRVPNLDPARINVGGLSGFALRILYGDLIELTNTKRVLYGDGLIDICNAALTLAGIAAKVTKIVWQDALPENRLETAQELDIEINKLGTVSKETAQEQLGRDPEVEKERLAEQQTGQLNLGAELLKAFQKGQAPQ